jgi:heme exporter protein A
MNLLARDLACRRGERIVFAGLSFSLGPKDALVVRGPNGAGKSSLLRLIAGLSERVRGELLCDGAEVSRDWSTFRARLHHLGHLDAIKPALTVAENLQFWAALQGGADRSDAALDRFGLLDLSDLPARLLSAGQRRRLALARLLAAPRPLWLLDEPTTALDAASIAVLTETAAEHRAGGGLVIAAAHGELALAASQTLILGPASRSFDLEAAELWTL